MKKPVLHSIFSTITALIVLLPFAMQTLHALEGHEHVYCYAENEKHFHKKEIDCQFYHLKITYNSFDFSNNFVVYRPQTDFQTFKDYSQSYFSLNTKSKSPRAPPYFIV